MYFLSGSETRGRGSRAADSATIMASASKDRELLKIPFKAASKAKPASEPDQRIEFAEQTEQQTGRIARALQKRWKY